LFFTKESSNTTKAQSKIEERYIYIKYSKLIQRKRYRSFTMKTKG
jgi:hypothetical protein